MQFDTTFLRSKVARRVFVLFILCALLPVTVLAVVSYTHVTGQLNEQNQDRLRRSSKAVGMSIYERLLFLEAEIELIASRLGASGEMAVGEKGKGFGDDLGKRLKGVVVVSNEGVESRVFGESWDPPRLTNEQKDHLRAGNTLVGRMEGKEPHARLFIGKRFDREGLGRRTLLAEINGAYLWGLGDSAGLPAYTEMCVIERPDAVLICSSGFAAGPSQDLLSRVEDRGSRNFEWQQGEQEYLAALWSIPLRFRFLAPTWTVVIGESKSVALAPLSEFTRSFPWVVLLALWIVCLLSLVQIRRNLTPLERLKEGTRRIAGRDFGSRVEIESGDEFEELAGSFNSMAVRLGKQFNALETIAEIDRAVLSALDADKIIDTVLARISEVLPCDYVSVTMRDPEKPDRGWLFFKDSRPRSNRVVEMVELGLTVLQQMHENPEHLLIPGDQVSGILPPLATRDLSSLLILPLFRSERLSGFLGLGRLQATAYGEEDLAQARQLANQVAAALANAQDLADRRRAEALLKESNQRLEAALDELKSTQKQMIQQERLRALGQMAGGIAHDFNNTLSPIVGFTELLLLNPKRLDDKDKIKEHLRIINTAARDATNVVSRLRDFYRPRDTDDRSASVALNRLAEQSIKLTQPKWKDQALARGVTVGIETDLNEVPPVGGDESELREVLTNLIFNAVDAMGESGTITLRTRVDGGHVVLEISDTGIGMTEEVRQRCLEPFFSTKGDHGTGLGLSMVYGIIRRHQGTIDIDTQPGQGTTFIIRFPPQNQKPSASETVRSTKTVGMLHVLVVDDNPLVCRVTTEYLATLGHRFETAASGREALEKFSSGQFDVVITDQGMPEMSGDRLAAAIKERSQSARVILLTGTGKLPEVEPARYAGVDVTLFKPLTMSALRDALVEVAGKPGPSPIETQAVGESS